MQRQGMRQMLVLQKLPETLQYWRSNKLSLHKTSKAQASDSKRCGSLIVSATGSAAIGAERSHPGKEMRRNYFSLQARAHLE